MMNRTQAFLCCVQVVALIATAAATAAGSAPPPPPSFILAVADDLSALDVHEATMPGIEQMKANGITFTHVYSMASCSPTRTTLLTGRYPHRHKMGAVTRPIGFQQGLFPLPDTFNTALPRSTATLAEVLRVSGYTTGIFGKWHLSNGLMLGPERLNHAPNDHGFDEAYHTTFGVQDYHRWTPIHNGSVLPEETRYHTDVLIEKADAFFRGTAGPKLLYLPFSAPHEPFHDPPGYVGPDDPRSRFVAAVRYLDAAFTRFVDDLDRDGLLENTYVFFMSDNGTPAAAAPTAALGDRVKGSMYDGGIRVPFVVRSPQISADVRGSSFHGLVNTTDLLRTLAELASIDLDDLLPQSYALDSISFSDALSDAAFAGARDFAMVVAYDRQGNAGPDQRTTNRTAIIDRAGYKLLRHEDELLLFDLAADPEESNPLDQANLTPDQQTAWDALRSEEVAFKGLEPARGYCDIEDEQVETATPATAIDLGNLFRQDAPEIRSMFQTTWESTRAAVDAQMADCIGQAPEAEWIADFVEVRSSTQIRIVREDPPGHEAEVELKLSGVVVNPVEPREATEAMLSALRERVAQYGKARFLEEVRAAFAAPDRSIQVLVHTNSNEHRSRDLD